MKPKPVGISIGAKQDYRAEKIKQKGEIIPSTPSKVGIDFIVGSGGHPRTPKPKCRFCGETRPALIVYDDNTIDVVCGNPHCSGVEVPRTKAEPMLKAVANKCQGTKHIGQEVERGMVICCSTCGRVIRFDPISKTKLSFQKETLMKEKDAPSITPAELKEIEARVDALATGGYGIKVIDTCIAIKRLLKGYDKIENVQSPVSSIRAIQLSKADARYRLKNSLYSTKHKKILEDRVKRLDITEQDYRAEKIKQKGEIIPSTPSQFCKWEEEVLNKIEDRDILLEFVPKEKQADFLHNFADVLFSFEQQAISKARAEMGKKNKFFNGLVCDMPIEHIGEEKKVVCSVCLGKALNKDREDIRATAYNQAVQDIREFIETGYSWFSNEDEKRRLLFYFDKKFGGGGK